MAAAGLAVSLAGFPAFAAVGPSPTPAPSGSAEQAPPLTVQLTGLTPLAPQPGDTLVLRGVLHNVSPAAVSGLQVQLLVSRDQVGSRGAFDGYADTPDGPFTITTFDAAPVHVTLGSPQVQPGATDRFSVSVAVDDLHLPAGGPWQVHALGVDVTGLTAAGTQTVGRLHTFLPWAPLVPGVGLPTQVAWIWPLVDGPHRSASAVWQDDALAGELADGGRLAGLVAAGGAAQTQHPPAPRRVRRPRHRRVTKPARPSPTVTPVPVTWAVDPLLIDDARAMAAGYRVRSPDGPRPGKGQAAATSWLTALRTATSHGSVLSLPYADPDVVAAVRSNLAAAVQLATSAGQALVERALGVTPLTFGWPPDGLLDQRTLDTLFAGGVTTVVLDDSALPVSGGPPSETPSAHTTVTARDGNLDALLVDGGLSAAVQDGADNPADAALDVQRVLCELLMIQAELPGDQRTIVIAPDRRWAPSSTYATALLAGSGRVPWIAPVSLAQAAETPVYDKVQRDPLAYPPATGNRPSGRLAELPRRYLRTVRGLKARLDTFAAILPPGNAKARTFDDALLRALSSRWRSDVGLADQRLETLRDELGSAMRQVHIASRPGSLVTLTSHSGTVPITVANDLDTPVHVVVGINSDQHLRIAGRGRVAKTILPHRQVPFDLRATAKTSGVFPLTVSLYTPGPGSRLYGEPVNLLVRSTAYGTVALVITVGATAMLLVAVVIRLTRRGLTARRVGRSAG
jgi:hypothetical protein